MEMLKNAISEKSLEEFERVEYRKTVDLGGGVYIASTDAPGEIDAASAGNRHARRVAAALERRVKAMV